MVKAACLVASKVGVLKEAESGVVLRLSVTALETVTGFSEVCVNVSFSEEDITAVA